MTLQVVAVIAGHTALVQVLWARLADGSTAVVAHATLSFARLLCAVEVVPCAVGASALRRPGVKYPRSRAR